MLPCGLMVWFISNSVKIIKHQCNAEPVKTEVNSPNPHTAIAATLREASQWSPYGLIPPLYWLASGIRLEE